MLAPQALQPPSRDHELLSSIEAVAALRHEQEGGVSARDDGRPGDDAHEQVKPAKKGAGGLLSAFAPSTVGSLLGFSSKRRAQGGSVREDLTTRGDVRPDDGPR